MNVFDGSANCVGAVGENRDVDGSGESSLKLGEKFLDAINYTDDVGTGLALNIHQDGWLLICPGGLQRIFNPVGDIRHVADANGSAIPIGHNDRTVSVSA